jgi:hypothetical protein
MLHQHRQIKNCALHQPGHAHTNAAVCKELTKHVTTDMHTSAARSHHVLHKNEEVGSFDMQAGLQLQQ